MRVSGDSITPRAVMESAAVDRGFDLYGLVGHEQLVDEAGAAAVAGIEHGRGDGSETPHVVEYPDLDFRFLAHPGRTFGTNVREQSLQFVKRHALDGVEKWNAGVEQYEGHLPVPEFANDDAHNTMQIGTSFMLVDAPSREPRVIVEALKAGNFEAMNREPSTLGDALKGFVVVSRTPRVMRDLRLWRPARNEQV